jgi:hypothetical protein
MKVGAQTQFTEKRKGWQYIDRSDKSQCSFQKSGPSHFDLKAPFTRAFCKELASPKKAS